MNLILGNTNINEESKQDSKFFGLTFDKYLKFDKQMNELRSKLQGRHNIIKHLVYTKYQITQKTHIGICKVIARSVIDYSSLFYPILSSKNQNNLESFQANIIRTILKCHYNKNSSKYLISNKSILEKAGLITIEERSKKIFYNYMNRCIDNNNQLIS